VVHLHPIVVEAYVCAKQGRQALERCFLEAKLPWVWVPYTHPGYTLATYVERLVANYRAHHGHTPSLLLLEKHGLFVTADSPAEVLDLTRRAIAACTQGLPKVKAAAPLAPAPEEVAAYSFAIRAALQAATGEYTAVRHSADEPIATFLGREDAKALVAQPALTPDEFVYMGGPPMWLDRPDATRLAARVTRAQAQEGKPPAGFIVPGVGLFATGTEKSLGTVRDVATASLAVRSAAAEFGGVNPLTRQQREFLQRWEGESFRLQVAGIVRAGELAGRIAIVTGAGSGLGRSIAMGLAKAGANVALADVDTAAAEETATRIAAQSPSVATRVVRCDVTKEQEVAQAFAGLVAHWGGLDVLVNAAGIAPAYALVDLPVEKWRLALEINLTGYFLMAQAAARVMIPQGMGGSIINLSSKSGLEASKSNTPYNATKAGEIHMARGWALELGEHGIRVNSVAPGNVFEGSKIWNPEYIKACAKKYGIEPEEVIPYYVSKTALGVEITGQDIADAIVFLCSDKARTITGQTLVADSGQVMVR
jgi:NAD(P)-dependent dehydrogenase (short-subunit alcohol dehydrogenase family)